MERLYGLVTQTGRPSGITWSPRITVHDANFPSKTQATDSEQSIRLYQLLYTIFCKARNPAK